MVGVGQVVMATVMMLPSGRLRVLCDCLLVDEVGQKQCLRVAQVLLPMVMMLPSGSLQVFCDCLLVNEVGLKQYLRVVKMLLPMVMMLPLEACGSSAIPSLLMKLG